MLIKSHTEPKQAFHSIFNELKQSSSDSRHPFRYMSLATFDKDRQESNIRMVILREVRKDKSLLAYTDVRTSKFADLSSLNKATLLFWHDRHKVQVTMKAEAELHHNDEVASQYWKQDVHGPARKAYTPLVRPGTPISEPVEAYSWPEEYTDEHFGVLIFKPYHLQILQLKGKEHLRLQFTRQNSDKEWPGGWIAP